MKNKIERILEILTDDDLLTATIVYPNSFELETGQEYYQVYHRLQVLYNKIANGYTIESFHLDLEIVFNEILGMFKALSYISHLDKLVQYSADRVLEENIRSNLGLDSRIAFRPCGSWILSESSEVKYQPKRDIILLRLYMVLSKLNSILPNTGYYFPDPETIDYQSRYPILYTNWFGKFYLQDFDTVHNILLIAKKGYERFIFTDIVYNSDESEPDIRPHIAYRGINNIDIFKDKVLNQVFNGMVNTCYDIVTGVKAESTEVTPPYPMVAMYHTGNKTIN